MSYQNGTTHFNLPQTVGSDKRDWFDTNEAFRNVDETLHTASIDSSTAIEQIAEANADIVAVDTKADGIADRVTVVEGKQATDEENISQNSLAITQLNSRVTGLGTDLAEMIEVTEEPSATATVQHTVGSYFRYNDNLWRTLVLIRVGDEIVPDVNCETTDVMSRVQLLEAGSEPVESVIDDTTTSTTKTWSSSKIDTELSAKAGDTRFNITTGKMQYFDGEDWVDISSSGGGTMLVADFNSFASGSTSGGGSFTAQEAGFIVGTSFSSASSTNNQSVTVNGVTVTTQSSSSGSHTTGYAQAYIPYKTGDSIVVTGNAFKCYKAVAME